MDFARHVSVATAPPSEKSYKSKAAYGSGGLTVASSNWKGSPRADRYFQPNPFPKPTSHAGPTNNKAQHHTTSGPVRHLTKSEWEERRSRGLCFRCGEKYTPQHKCSAGQLRVLLLADGEEVDEAGEIRAIGVENIGEYPTDGECKSLDLCSVISDSSYLPSQDPKTLKLMGEISNYPALILVDSGATHNFISKKLVRALGLDLFAIGPLGIRLGDGNKVWVTGQCRNVPLKFGSFTCRVDALVYDIGPLDFILGVAWLKLLGDVLFNWQTHEIKFWQNGTPVLLKGVNCPLDNPTSLRTCLGGSMIQLGVDTPGCSVLHQSQQEQLEALLIEFANLFKEP